MATKLRRVGLAVVVIAAIALSASGLSAQAVAPELFTAPDSTNSAQMTAMSGELSSLFASRTQVVLNESAFAAGYASITLGGVAHLATLESFERRQDSESNGSVGRWTLEGATWPSTITVKNGLLTGTFYSEDRQYFLMPGYYGQAQELVEIDPSAVMSLRQHNGESDVVVPSHLSMETPNLLVPMTGLNEYEVTLLYFYTQSASDMMGGDAQMEVFIQNKVDCINTSLLNSGYTDGHVRLVHVQKWSRNASGDRAADLYALATDPAIAAIRDQYRADLVGELVGNEEAGLAYWPGNTWNRGSGFHLTATSAALIDFSLDHEWGHNMGAQHDPANAQPPGEDPYSFARGYIYHIPGNSEDIFSDVESYTTVREPFFSNSSGNWQGFPMGTPEQDNLRVIRIGFQMVSQYYPETGCIPSSTALCLLNSTGVTQGSSRFRITIDWINFVGQSGSGQAVAMTSDGGYFWFFNQNNPEVMVKMVNGASANGHFWVFIAGTTNVEVTVNVTDTITGSSRSWHNPLNRMFVSVGDIEAFPQ